MKIIGSFIRNEMKLDREEQLERLEILAFLSFVLAFRTELYGWVVLNVWILYASFRHTEYLVSQNASGLLIRSGRRRQWYLKKVLWNLLFVTFCYLLIYVVTGGIMYLQGVTDYVFINHFLLAVFSESEAGIFLARLLPFLITMDLVFIQMMLFVFVRPVIACSISIGCFLFVEFITTIVNNGNSPLRYYLRGLIVEGITAGEGIVLSVILLFIGVICAAVGWKRFQRYDFM